MKKIVVTLLLFLNLHLLAESKVTLVPYLSYAAYEGNVTNNDTLTGLYALFDEDTESLELAIELKYLNYTNNSSLSQANFVASYKTYLESNLKLNTLVHYILNNDSQSNGSLSMLSGINYKTQNNIWFGFQTTFSLYSAQALANKFLQFKPSIEFTLGHKRANFGLIYPKISFYYIVPFSVNNSSIKSNYFSTEIDIVHVKGAFSSKASMWFGEQINAVRDNGFTVYNLKEIHNSGFTLSSRYKIDDTKGLKLAYSNEYYTMLGNSTQLFYDRLLLIADFNY